MKTHGEIGLRFEVLFNNLPSFPDRLDVVVDAERYSDFVCDKIRKHIPYQDKNF